MIERLLAADAALERGEADAAERLYTQVADADPRNAIAVVGLGRVALARGDRDEARRRAEQALAIDADEAAARRMLDSLTTPATAALPEQVLPPPEHVPPPAEHVPQAEHVPPPPGRDRGLWGFVRRLLRRR